MAELTTLCLQRLSSTHEVSTISYAQSKGGGLMVQQTSRRVAVSGGREYGEAVFAQVQI